MLIFSYLLIVVVIFCVMRMMNKEKFTTKYDEMQELVRGKAYKYAFWTVCILEAIAGFIGASGVTLPFENTTLHFVIMMVGVTVHTTYSIWHNAYIGLNTNVKRYTVVCVLIAILNFVNAILSIRSGSMFEDGKFGFGFINLFIGVLFVFVAAEIFIRNRIDAKEE